MFPIIFVTPGQAGVKIFSDPYNWIPVFTPARWSATARKHGNDDNGLNQTFYDSIKNGIMGD